MVIWKFYPILNYINKFFCENISSVKSCNVKKEKMKKELRGGRLNLFSLVCCLYFDRCSNSVERIIKKPRVVSARAHPLKKHANFSPTILIRIFKEFHIRPRINIPATIVIILCEIAVEDREILAFIGVVKILYQNL